jgi:hypothetical protein
MLRMAADTRSAEHLFTTDLREARASDGGFGFTGGAASEVEPTAIAALALDDAEARGWLAAAQRPDGGFAALDGRPESPSVGALAALALDDRNASSRALAHAVAGRAAAVGESGDGDGDGRDGWGWTTETYSWVEPTSRVLLATKILRPSDAATRAEAVRILRERRCPNGAWNYGNASVNGVDTRPYAQTTAVALMALQREPASLVARPLRFLESRWRDEPGGITLAQSLVALRLHGSNAVAADVAMALEAVYRKTAFLGNTLALAWAVLATSSDATLDQLRSVS